jgi:hypothetical protein
MRTKSPIIVHAPKPKRTYRRKRKPCTLAIDAPRIVTVKSAKQLKREREMQFRQGRCRGQGQDVP